MYAEYHISTIAKLDNQAAFIERQLRRHEHYSATIDWAALSNEQAARAALAEERLLNESAEIALEIDFYADQMSLSYDWSD
ncbi:hypothetical protein M2337_003417 [Sphingobium sp. B2D3A]|uniref:hypothetical protein n=1 Tax=unclassified Sphingobium TaxID=2611147 RepID=UPI0022253DF8|nr:MULTISPECIES: hypothetical protein [unclassified Sphingobium]MCW2339127.1 hypothetical protein [Sphingobium sp. B2D3A]MCW2386929.1 hypothetical protein [Sphingobium sp. B2D3D]